MVKGVYILKSHLDAIVCLSEPMVFAGENTATVSPPTERIIDQTQRAECVKDTVEERLRMEERMDGEMLNIEVRQGHTTLYGNTETEQPNGHANDIASMVPGILEGTNSITVPPSPSKNHHLRKAVWNTLRGVDVLREQTNTLHIHAKDGVVTLSGMVETELQKAAAGKSADSVSGVKKFINAILVRTLPF